jgi:cytidylate kinase
VSARALVIAIDGVVGSGKSTTARRVAEKLGYRHLDTGAMYRAVALAASRRGVLPDDGPALGELLQQVEIDLLPLDQGGNVLLNGEDVSEEIRRPEVARIVGSFADQPMVRRDLVARQRRLGQRGGVVAEGRDMGSVVFPEAELKIRMVADLHERAQRRHGELKAKGLSITYEQVCTDIEARDREDAERDYGAIDSEAERIEIDTTGMTLEQQVDKVVELARQRGA